MNTSTLALVLFMGMQTGCSNNQPTVPITRNSGSDSRPQTSGVGPGATTVVGKPPVITNINPAQPEAVYGQMMAITLSATDPDNDTKLTYEIVTGTNITKVPPNSSGIFMIPIPPEIGTGNMEAIAKVTDSTGLIAATKFNIITKGKPGASPITTIGTGLCTAMVTDPNLKNLCALLGAIPL